MASLVRMACRDRTDRRPRTKTKYLFGTLVPALPGDEEANDSDPPDASCLKPPDTFLDRNGISHAKGQLNRVLVPQRIHRAQNSFVPFRRPPVRHQKDAEITRTLVQCSGGHGAVRCTACGQNKDTVEPNGTNKGHREAYSVVSLVRPREPVQGKVALLRSDLNKISVASSKA